MERGKTNPTMAFLIVMADVFGLRMSQLLARAEHKQRKNKGADLPAEPSVKLKKKS